MTLLTDRRWASRRRLLQLAGMTGLGLVASQARGAETSIRLSPPLPGGPDERDLTGAFPQKGAMILQRTRPPLLETPFEVFDQGAFTPNDRFFVRWHLAYIPTEIKVDEFRLAVHGHVNQSLSLTLTDILAFPRVELAAVNQCSGNSRGYFMPRVPGGEWSNGAMGNARWAGVRLKDILDRAGVKAGAVQVRFRGMDGPVIPETPEFMKSLDIDHARDGEVMIAYAMNGEQLPLLNGFPIRVIVPGWYSTYWVKMLSDIEVLDKRDDNFWMAQAYLIPDTPHASVKPSETGFKSVPINRMVPRSFITNLAPGAAVRAGQSTLAPSSRLTTAARGSPRNSGPTRGNTASGSGRRSSRFLLPANACSRSAAPTATARRSPTRRTGTRAGSCATSSSRRLWSRAEEAEDAKHDCSVRRCA
jgi:DMSO/TMAO reductase YedYZ molybdopterin-dependent catalytic subunit